MKNLEELKLETKYLKGGDVEEILKGNRDIRVLEIMEGRISFSWGEAFAFF